MLRSLLISLALTLAIECLLALPLGVRGVKNFLVIVCANVITNPAVVLLYHVVRCRMSDTILLIAVIAALEVSAVLIEGWIYQQCLEAYHKLSPWLLALILNAVSFGAGLLLKGELL